MKYSGVAYGSRHCRFSVLTVAVSCLALVSASAQEVPKAPPKVFMNPVFERPAWLPAEVQPADFVPAPERAAAVPAESLLGSPAVFHDLVQFLRDDERGRQVWRREAGYLARVVNAWQLSSGFGSERYTYVLRDLERLMVAYVLTGDRALGELIQQHIRYAANLPMEFWIHEELRRYNPKEPQGGLETAHLAAMLAKVLTADSHELFSAEEHAMLRETLSQKGHVPLMNWLRARQTDKSNNNWLAVIASCGIVSAKALGRQDDLAYCLKRLKGYLDDAIEDDGSYGEGPGYFNYPITTIISQLPALSAEEQTLIFKDSPLRNISQWLASGYYFMTDTKGKSHPCRVTYGDNGHLYWLQPCLALLVNAQYGDMLLPYLCEWYRGANWQNRLVADALQMRAMALDLRVAPAGRSPADLGLPLLWTFASGESILRDSWEPNSPVLAMMGAKPTKVNYVHRRPESNSVVMAAYGEYFVVSANSASYRSPLHGSWDRSTISANTIMINDQDQLFPYATGFGVTAPRFVRGRPQSRITAQADHGDFALIAQESAEAYAVPMTRALRAVLLLRDCDVFVVIDDFAAREGRHQFDCRWHFYNRDGKATLLAQEAPGQFLLTRPRADLAVTLFSAAAMQVETGKGYMHNSSRDYSPGGKNEGALGSSLELLTRISEQQAITLITVLQPLRKESKPLPVNFADGILRVGDKDIGISDGRLQIGDKSVALYAE
ncbi:MAG: heparinase II/III domain-containing protein [Lentisphaeria bacterium]|jgi:hypothetical protein